MDCVTEEGSLPHDAASQEPPTLIGCPLDFGNMPQGSRKTLQQIIANTTRKPMIWLADAGKSRWLCIEPDHGILQPGAQQPIRVTADTTALAVGEYAVTLTFSSEGDETSMSKPIPGNVTVGKPVESPTPLSLTAGLHLGCLTPQSTQTVGLVISNPDSRSIDWHIQIGSGESGMGNRVHFDHLDDPANHRKDFATGQNKGIIVSPPNGSLNSGESATIYVTANAKDLTGDYAYTTNLTLISSITGANNALSTSVQVPVVFHVSVQPYNDGGPKTPTDLPPHIGISIPPQQPSGTYRLSFTNNPVNAGYSDINGVASNGMVDWTLNSPNTPPLPAWLVANVPSGKFNPGQNASVLLTAHRGGLAKGLYATNVYLTFTWDVSANLVGMVYTCSVPVNLTVE